MSVADLYRNRGVNPLAVQLGKFPLELYVHPLFADANLVAYYRMEDANDSKGTLHLTNVDGSFSDANGKWGKGVGLNGSTAYLTCANAAFQRSDGQPITVMCWMLPNRLGGQYQSIVINRTDGIYNWMLYMHTDGGELSFHGAAQNKSAYVPSTSTWTHVAATVDASGNMELYANGANEQSVSGFQYHADSVNTLGIGGYVNTNPVDCFQGKIDDVAIFSRALSAAEISSFYTWATMYA